ncbi:transposase, partial [Yersinia pestis subsp. microtus bv. Caucasica]
MLVKLPLLRGWLALNPRSWIFLSMIWRFGSMKHPFSTRLAAVQHYLSGKATLR